MKTINRIRVKNPYFYISLITLLVGLWITWFFESNFAEILFMNYDAPDLAGIPKSELMLQFMSGILNWERYIDSAMRYIMHIFPIFAVIPVIPFLFERKSYFVFGAARFQNWTNSLLKTMARYTVNGGLCISLAFVIFFSVGNIFMVPSLTDIGGFASIFPKDFYFNHAYLFWIFMAVTIYFLVGCVFSGMACAVALHTDKEYLVLIIPELVYIIDSYVGGGFDIHLFQISSCVGAFNTIYSTWETFIPLLPLALLDILLVYAGIRRRKHGIVC